MSPSRAGPEWSRVWSVQPTPRMQDSRGNGFMRDRKPGTGAYVTATARPDSSVATLPRRSSTCRRVARSARVSAKIPAVCPTIAAVPATARRTRTPPADPDERQARGQCWIGHAVQSRHSCGARFCTCQREAVRLTGASAYCPLLPQPVGGPGPVQQMDEEPVLAGGPFRPGPYGPLRRQPHPGLVDQPAVGLQLIDAGRHAVHHRRPRIRPAVRGTGRRSTHRSRVTPPDPRVQVPGVLLPGQLVQRGKRGRQTVEWGVVAATASDW